ALRAVFECRTIEALAHVSELTAIGTDRARRLEEPLLALSDAELEELRQHYPQIDDVLPLSPLQEGLLFHALYDTQSPDIYTVQIVLELTGPLDRAMLRD